MFVIDRTTCHGYSNWFKFDDGDVSDCKMDDDEVPYACMLFNTKFLTFSSERRADLEESAL